jgi:hypothetical protein
MMMLKMMKILFMMVMRSNSMLFAMMMMMIVVMMEYMLLLPMYSDTGSSTSTCYSRTINSDYDWEALVRKTVLKVLSAY